MHSLLPCPQVIAVARAGSMQLCVPREWDDEKVLRFAGTRTNVPAERWRIRPDGDPRLLGDPSRRRCSQFAGYVHIVLDIVGELP